MRAVTLTHAVHSKKKRPPGVPTHTGACNAYMKGKEGLKGDALRLIWLKGGLWRGGVGGGLRPEINESPKLYMSHMWGGPTGL